MSKKIAAAIAFALVVFCLHAQHPQEHVPFDSPKLSLGRLQLVAMGRVGLLNAMPLTYDQLISQIDDTPGLNLWIEERPGESNDLHYNNASGLQARIKPVLGLETYARGNPDFGSLYHGYIERLPVINFSTALIAGSYVYLYADYELREEYFAVNGDGWPNVNLPSDFGYFDFQLPIHAYGSVGGDFWNVSLGRERKEWVSGNSGSLVLSERAHFYEYLRWQLYSSDIMYTNLLINMEPLLLDGESDGPESKKTFLAHRFDFLFFDDRVHLTVTEGTLLGGINVELKHLNPLMIFHSFTDWTNASSLFSLALNVTPFPMIEIYSEFVMNQIQLSYETQVYEDDAMPNAMGYLGGFRVVVPFSDNLSNLFFGGVEFAHTDPWLYVRESPFISYHWRRRVFSNVEGNGIIRIVTEPMGYQYGPDARVIDVHLGYRSGLSFAASLGFRYIANGEKTVSSPFATGDEAVKLRTPTGVAEKTYLTFIETEYEPLEYLRLTGTIAWYNVQNYLHQTDETQSDVQMSVGVEIDPVELIKNTLGKTE